MTATGAALPAVPGADFGAGRSSRGYPITGATSLRSVGVHDSGSCRSCRHCGRFVSLDNRLELLAQHLGNAHGGLDLPLGRA
jgi:hypothetical protein